MSPDDELMLILGILHLVALVLGVVLFAMFLSSDARSDRNPPDDDDSGGGNDRLGDRPKTSPSGGIPLPDAEPSSVRLRGYGRLADAYRRERRRVVEPAQPGRRTPNVAEGRRVSDCLAGESCPQYWPVPRNQRWASAHAGLRVPS